jgi:hypothetical protein
LCNFLIVIVDPTLNKQMDTALPRVALVPHEDVLTRTLAYERDVQAWRRKEVFEGRGDPGRPEYFEGYPVR